MGIGEPSLRDARFLHFPQKENIVKGRYHRKKRDYVGKIPKLGGGWGGSDPNPLLDVYLPSKFWHAKMILIDAHRGGGVHLFPQHNFNLSPKMVIF